MKSPAGPNISVLSQKKGIIPFFLEGTQLIAQQRNKLITYDILTEQIVTLATIPGTWAARLSRLSPYSMNFFRSRLNWVCKSNSGEILVCNREGVYCLENGSLVREFAFKDRKYFLDVHVSSDIPGFEDGLYVGEYFSNAAMDEVAIWFRSEDGGWKKIWQFEEKMINHIHAIVPDQANGCQWVLAGDFDSGPAFWKARNNFAEMEMVTPAHQDFRACWLFNTGESIFWATDTQLVENALFQAPVEDLANKKKLSALPGSSIYGTSVGKHYIFSTTLEPERASRKQFSAWFDTKPSAALREDGAALFAIDDQGGNSEFLASRPNGLPLRLFEYPSFLLAKNHHQDKYFCAYGRSVKVYNHRLIVCRID